jgi:hypothetical protein
MIEQYGIYVLADWTSAFAIRIGQEVAPPWPVAGDVGKSKTQDEAQ